MKHMIWSPAFLLSRVRDRGALSRSSGALLPRSSVPELWCSQGRKRRKEEWAQGWREAEEGWNYSKTDYTSGISCFRSTAREARLFEALWAVTRPVRSILAVMLRWLWSLLSQTLRSGFIMRAEDQHKHKTQKKSYCSCSCTRNFKSKSCCEATKLNMCLGPAELVSWTMHNVTEVIVFPASKEQEVEWHS